MRLYDFPDPAQAAAIDAKNNLVNMLNKFALDCQSTRESAVTTLQDAKVVAQFTDEELVEMQTTFDSMALLAAFTKKGQTPSPIADKVAKIAPVVTPPLGVVVLLTSGGSLTMVATTALCSKRKAIPTAVLP